MTGGILHHHVMALDAGRDPAPGAGTIPAELAALLADGIGVLREAGRVHLIAHRDLDLAARAARPGLEAVLRQAPEGMLLVPASPAQARHLVHSEVEGQTIWNVQQVFALSRPAAQLDLARLDRALAVLSERQDVLRTSFLRAGSGWVQVIATPATPCAPVRVERVSASTPQEFQRFIAERRAEPFAVERAPLFRVWAACIGAAWHLGFTAHHAVADAFTLPLFFSQVMALHDGAPAAPAVREQVWQDALAAFDPAPPGRDAALRFWRACLPAGTARRAPASSGAEGESFARAVPADLVAGLDRLHAAHGITHAQLFTAALALLLVHGMGEASALIRGFHSRRDRAGLLDTLGDFSDLLLIPYEVPLDEPVLAFLTRTRTRSLAALRHRLPFAQLEALALEAAGSVALDVLFDSVDLDTGTAANPHGQSLFTQGLLDPDGSGVGRAGPAVADLFFQPVRLAGVLTLVCAWRQSLFTRTEAEQAADLLLSVARAMAEAPERTVGALVAEFAASFKPVRDAGEKASSRSQVLRDRPAERPSPVGDEALIPAAPRAARSCAPECQRLNQGNGDRRPVFWVHGAFGDASVYLPLAARLDRPVHGLQARGLFDDALPIAGVPAIAAFYRGLIREVQPHGPYDLAGYSIGGTFAYEIARQLQAAGEEVASLTLVDALYPPEHARIGGDAYDHLHFVAMGLIGVSLRRDPSWSPEHLAGLPRPGRDITDPHDLLEAFVAFCRRAGVRKSPDWLRTYLRRMMAIQEAYQVAAYAPEPLPRPIGAVRYLKNRDGLFYGRRAAYLNPRREDPLRGVDYASGWRALLPGLRFEDHEVDNHIEMMADEQVLAALAAPEPARADAAPCAVADLLRGHMARILDRPADQVDLDAPLERLGLDSLVATELTQRLRGELGEAVSIALFFQHRTLRDLARHLSDPALAPRPPEAPAPEAPMPVPAARPARDAIAVIGVSGRYPNAPDLDAYWRVLRDGVDCVTEIPPERWDWRAYYSPDRDRAGAHYSKWGGFIADVDCFDPLFFSISPREAAVMDPQERLFLQQAWAALEDAGYRAEDVRGAAASVYAGVMYGEYQFLGVEESLKGARQALGGSYASIANRVSHVLDLHGPSMAVDTACSSSLTAIHMACRDLREGVSDLAIAGGVSLSLHPNKYLLLSAGQFISGAGRCESFGAGGDGFIPAEGVGVVILKHLADAERDGDNIQAVIRASAINHGGHTNGYTVPSPAAQARVIGAALRQAGVDPRWISYVEAHGTGTRVGDPIEVAGLTQAFGPRAEAEPCWIGSAKSNLGHCEAAAGVAGLTKIVLQMRHGQIAPSLHAAVLNPHIDFSRTPFRVNRSLRPWERPVVEGEARPRIAGLSSFGAGGSNAHLLVEEYPAPEADDEDGAPVAIVLSARTPDGLARRVEELAAWLDQLADHPAPSLRRIAHGLQVGREAMAERLGLVARSREELRARLKDLAAGQDMAGVYRGRLRPDDPWRRLFADEAELADVVSRWLAAGRLDKVLEAWVQGAPVEWRRLYASGRPRRLSLPTYPFRRERHWIDRAPAPPAAPVAAPAAADMLLAVPAWREAPLLASTSFRGRRLVFACGVGALEGAIVLHCTQEDAGARFEDLAAQMFSHLRQVAGADARAGLLVQLAVPNGGDDALPVALAGELRALAREYPAIATQTVMVDPAGAADLPDLLAREAAGGDDMVLHEDGRRRVRTWHEIAPQGVAPAWRPGGTWLITGGLGGLGLIFARDIARAVPGARLVLVGRSPLADAGAEALRALEELGARVHYRRADVTSRAQVEALVAALGEEGLSPTGVIHAAGIVRDNFLLRKSPEEFAAVLAPKVRGAVNLDRALAGLPLDHFLLFSSAAGALGNAGQADYAAANAFLDAFAAWRAAKVAQGARSGRTLAIGWPLWRDGGMGVDPATRAALAETTGMVPMETGPGVAALHRLLSLDVSHALVFQGDVARLRAHLLHARPTPAGAPMEDRINDPEARTEATLARLRALFGELIKLDPEQVDPDEALERYGIDSVLVTRLNQRLDAVFGGVSKTLFFEYRRLRDIAGHLAREFPAACARWCDAVPQMAAPQNPAPEPKAPVPRARALEPAPAGADEPIAIIGLAGHYGGAPTLDAFWAALRDGRDLVTEIPPERWPLEGFFEPDLRAAVAAGKSYGKWGAFLPDFDRFDPFFFNISPREARLMDPQERWLLRCAWEALEDAAYTRQDLARLHGGRVGVFVGVTSTGFDLHGPDLWRRGDAMIPRTCFGSMANRISHVLDLNGPSLAIDTMCSSSLTALHQACEDLRRGACELAIVGAVNLYLHPASYRNLSANRMLSADGRCASFGKGGNGFVPGEGAGALLLKPAARARADGDRIHALIRGSAVNHGGHASGYTVPNPVAQAELIRAALRRAGVTARRVNCFEAHGTGTALGDPVEVTGMTRAFQADTAERGFCALGSVKSNIGHLEAAAGLAGLTKIVLQMRHRQLAPTLHAREVNPNIDFSATPFRLQQELAPWTVPEGAARIACLSSFGAGGTNAHVVLEQAEPVVVAGPAAPGPWPVVLSARTAERLQAQARRLAGFLARADEAPALLDVAYTLQCGREAMAHRLGLVAASLTDLKERLQAFADGNADGLHLGDAEASRDKVRAQRADPDLAGRIARALAAGDWDTLLALWVEGHAVPFEGVWARAGTRAPRRIGLPPYAFARERYWFDPPAPLPQASEPASARIERISCEADGWDGFSWLPCWEPRDAAPVAPRAPEGTVLILHGGGVEDFVSALERRLERDMPGARVARLAFAAAPEAWADALDRHGPVARFYVIAGADGSDPLAQALPLLRLARTLTGRADRDAVVDGFVLLADAPGRADGAGLDGLACAMAQGDHRFHMRNLLIAGDEMADPACHEALLDRIAGEGASARGEQVRLGAGGRQVRAFLPLTWGGLGGGFKDGGTYLIVGGAGTVGRIVTRHLVTRHQARVIWMGRRPADALACALAEYPSGSLAYIQADVRDPAALAAGLDEIARRFGALDGAVFAGKLIALEERLDRMDEATFCEIVALKTRGLAHLVAALERHPPGFLCVFSSAQAFSFLPASESVSYAAAITACDRLARALAARASFPIGLVNWGYWAASVTGTAVEDTLSRHFRFIDEEQGLAVLERFVAALRAGVLDQVLCVGVGAAVERLMGGPAREAVTLAEPVPEACRAFAPPPARPPQGAVAGRAQREALDRQVARLLHAQLRRCPRSVVLAKHARLMREFDAIADPGPAEADPWPAWEAYRAGLRLPELMAAADLADGCLRALPDILRGAVPATGVLFPGGSLRKVEALYAGNGLSDHFNRHLAATVAAFVAAHPGPVRILEVGAGTGSTTLHVAEALRPHLDKVSEYKVTDLSEAFLIQARQRFAWFSAMTQGLLDIQRPLGPQGIAAGAYDVVIATNVLHATRNIGETLAHAKAALRRGGILLVNEIVEKSVVGTVTYGLLDGWWLFDAGEARVSGSPLLDLPGWRRALAHAGFSPVLTLTGAAAELGQEVLLGVSDGLIRQPREGAAPEPAPPAGDAQAVLEAAEPEAAPAELEALLRAALVDTLGGGETRIRRDVAFADYGVDSILGAGFIERVNARLGLDLNASLLFERTTLAQLAGHIRTHHAGAMPAPARPAEPGAPDAKSESSFRNPGFAPRTSGVPEVSRLEIGSGNNQSLRGLDTVCALIEEKPSDIAVVGLSGRFPGAADADAFWQVLIRGARVIGPLSPAFQAGGYGWGALLEDRDGFDPLFFNISPREAQSMNRHQRLVLQEGWRALENAGCNPRSLTESRTGIFVGAEPCGTGGESFTGTSDAIVASRLSYVLGLRGPALVVNTGCSSSGVALHLACQSLRDGEVDMALAAGAAVALDPGVLADLAGTGMLSPTGRCLSFDHRADGTVLSEGVGVVVLKRLADARAAGDAIHGVIVASGLNQDGASNGITAPSGPAQEALIRDTHRRFGIDPGAISYVETHGTGTALGDPVEANALKRAFLPAQAAGTCVIGSAKAHIGHTSAASGVIGLIKLLLCLRHRLLPALPGFERLNPRIDLTGTPFRIPNAPVPWNMDEGALAALNSFGHSGTNAHLVVRAWPRANDPEPAAGPCVVPLSARDEEGLRRVAARLSAHLKAHPDLRLADVAHTLRVGREAMETRAVFEAADLHSLVSLLDQFGAGRSQAVAPGSPAARWLAGEDVDWPVLASAGACPPRRVPLPAYPFATEPYPLAGAGVAAPAALHAKSGGSPGDSGFETFAQAPRGLDPKSTLIERMSYHPLVQSNQSGLEGVCFAARFDGTEFFLADHQVHGRPLLPGVAYLEMARAAVARAAGRPPARLEDVTWERPLDAGEGPLEVRIALTRGDRGQVEYLIFSDRADGERRVHGSGVAVLEAPQGEGERLDLDALRAALPPAADKLAACASAFATMGVRYGPAFRATTELRAAEGRVLARLDRPEGVTGEAFHLHPSLMDCALQAALVLTLDATHGAVPAEPVVPFALERIDLLGQLPARVHALVRRAADSPAGAAVEKLDLDLSDDTGRVLARLRGFSSRRLSPPAVPEADRATSALSLMAPVWDALAPPAGPLEPGPRAAVLVVGGTREQHAAIRRMWLGARHLPLASLVAPAPDLRLSARFDHVLWLAPEGEDTADGMVLPLFRLVKALLAAGYDVADLGWTLVTTGARAVAAGAAERPAQAALHGFAGSMAKEFPHWRVRVLDLEPGKDACWADCALLSFPSGGEPAVHRGGTWFHETLAAVPHMPVGDVPYRQGGVYVVIGGAGGLGLVWSRLLVARHGARIIWVGRRPLDARIRQAILDLSALGPAPVYIEADAADPVALRAVRERVLRELGRLDGLVHCAIVLRDRSLVAMEEADLRAALAPKSDVSVAMAQVFEEDALDFVLFFSSLQSFTRAAGQSNYAAGSAFADSFAHQLARRWTCPVKVANWGYWGGTGIVADDAHRARMARAGLDSITPEEGMDGLDRLMGGPFDRLALVRFAAGTPSREALQGGGRIELYPAVIPAGLEVFEP